MRLKDKLDRAVKKGNWELIEWNGGFIRTVTIKICVTEKGKVLPIRFSFEQGWNRNNGEIYQREEFTFFESKAFMTGSVYKLYQLKEVIGVDPSELDFSIPREMVKFPLSEEELKSKEWDLMNRFNKEMFGY